MSSDLHQEVFSSTEAQFPPFEEDPDLPDRKVLAPCCSIDREIQSAPTSLIKITEALKISDYTAYHIDSFNSNYEAKRRYSEFEALRTILEKSYTTCVVPPIPEKHSLGERKDDQKIIQKRKRLLSLFLNRVASHPILGRDHVFHQFIEGKLSWIEIISANSVSHLLKRTSAGIGKLVERTILKNHATYSDPQFLAAEDYTFRFSHQISLIYRLFKKIAKSFSDIADVEGDLGKRYNAWSLIDSQLSAEIENIGSVFDVTSAASGNVSRQIDEKVVELLSEFVAFAKVVEKLLKFRHRKHADLEAISENIATKQANLEKWEASESEAQRISAVLNAEGSLIKAQPQGFLATLNSFIDNDPELTRRNNISKTRDALVNLTEAERMAKAELAVTNKEIQADLDRFQIEKVGDMKRIFLAYAYSLKEYHQACLEAWEKVKV